MESSFEDTIREHLELKRRNERLDWTFPLEPYRATEALANHSLFRSEAEARLEEEGGLEAAEESDWLWLKPPAFDWGD